MGDDITGNPGMDLDEEVGVESSTVRLIRMICEQMLESSGTIRMVRKWRGSTRRRECFGSY